MKYSRRVAVVSGIVVGIGVCVLDVYLYEYNWLVIILKGGIFGALFGLCLGFIARAISSVKTKSCLHHLLAVFSLSVAGLLLGIGVIFGLDRLPSGQWYQILPPPEKPVHFIGQSAYTFWGGTFFIESESGNIFSYTCIAEDPCEWKKEEILPGKPEENRWTCPPDYEGSYIPPIILFEKVIDTYQIDICGVDYTIQANLAIRGDGTIWAWTRFSGNEFFFAIFVWPIVCAGVGFLAYLLMVIRRKKDEEVDL